MNFKTNILFNSIKNHKIASMIIFGIAISAGILSFINLRKNNQ